MFNTNININELNRQAWLKKTLGALPAGLRVLDACTGELQNRQQSAHLEYVSQDFCRYEGQRRGTPAEGLQSKSRDTRLIHLVSDITAIPASDASFDVILCSEVLEHVPESTHAVHEFARLLRPVGVMILTAPFGSNVHMAPYNFGSGFSKYCYKHHLTLHGFDIKELTPIGDWYSLLRQKITRNAGLERQRGNWIWPLAYALLGVRYFKLRRTQSAEDLACFGWHCVAWRPTPIVS